MGKLYNNLWNHPIEVLFSNVEFSTVEVLKLVVVVDFSVVAFWGCAENTVDRRFLLCWTTLWPVIIHSKSFKPQPMCLSLFCRRWNSLSSSESHTYWRKGFSYWNQHRFGTFFSNLLEDWKRRVSSKSAQNVPKTLECCSPQNRR